MIRSCLADQFGSIDTLNFKKLEIRATLIAISYYLKAKFDYGYFIFLLPYGSQILHKKFQVISRKNEGVTVSFDLPFFNKKIFKG